MAILILSASKPIASSKLSSALGRCALIVSAVTQKNALASILDGYLCPRKPFRKSSANLRILERNKFSSRDFCILQVCREYVPKTAYKTKKLLNKYPLRPTPEIITNNRTLSTTRGYLQHDSIFTKLSLLSTFRTLIHSQMLPITFHPSTAPITSPP